MPVMIYTLGRKRDGALEQALRVLWTMFFSFWMLQVFHKTTVKG